jgi:hypothetical protein
MLPMIALTPFSGPDESFDGPLPEEPEPMMPLVSRERPSSTPAVMPEAEREVSREVGRAVALSW